MYSCKCSQNWTVISIIIIEPSKTPCPRVRVCNEYFCTGKYQFIIIKLVPLENPWMIWNYLIVSRTKLYLLCAMKCTIPFFQYRAIYICFVGRIQLIYIFYLEIVTHWYWWLIIIYNCEKIKCTLKRSRVLFFCVENHSMF